MIHNITFTSDYGKQWSIDYGVKDREVTGIISLSINGNNYPVKTTSREDRILNLVSRYVDLIENALT